MICPWLKKVTKGKSDWGETVTKESFLPCEGDECPWYVAEMRGVSGIIPAHCKRAETEHMKAVALYREKDSVWLL